MSLRAIWYQKHQSYWLACIQSSLSIERFWGGQHTSPDWVHEELHHIQHPRKCSLRYWPITATLLPSGRFLGQGYICDSKHRMTANSSMARTKFSTWCSPDTRLLQSHTDLCYSLGAGQEHADQAHGEQSRCPFGGHNSPLVQLDSPAISLPIETEPHRLSVSFPPRDYLAFKDEPYKIDLRLNRITMDDMFEIDEEYEADMERKALMLDTRPAEMMLPSVPGVSFCKYLTSTLQTQHKHITNVPQSHYTHTTNTLQTHHKHIYTHHKHTCTCCWLCCLLGAHPN